MRWSELFPEAFLVNSSAPISDHSPIVLKVGGEVRKAKLGRFRFENKWLKELGISQIIRDCWTNLASVELLEKLTSTAVALQIWARHAHEESRRVKLECERIVSRLEHSMVETDVQQVQDAKRKLGEILLKEEIYWKQRSKQFWLKEGDKNTRFFHSMASARKKLKTISKLQRDDGTWTESETDIQEVVGDYFQRIFSGSRDTVDCSAVVDRVQPLVDEATNISLTRPFSQEEFKDAIFQMNPDKAPGPDGFNPAFFQKFWSIIGEDIVVNSMKWLEEFAFPEGLNSTNIVLIPKTDNPTQMKDLRPIALCNVLYKIVSKVLCNRLKSALPGIVDKAQSAFVKGRSIQDNILIAFEAIHTMKRKNRGKFGELALKIDISKAYDRVEWDYLAAILQRIGFCDKWINWMKMCVCTVDYNVLVEQNLIGPIVPCRGLRQGDPLSPYLFILCAEGLSAMLNFEMRSGRLHGMRMGKHGPPISHLMFADDSILFCRASASECYNLKQVLHIYEKASGQAVNFQKSGIFFSKNVAEVDQQEISNVLGVFQPLNTGRYLGLPSLIGRSKKEIFAFLRDRLWRRFQGWQNKKLSKAGKEVLIKAVAQALPSYCMTSFLIPVTLTEELERMMNSFWWGNNNNNARGISWMRWDKLCTHKDIGGMGFRKLHLFNIAMLGKIGWRLIADPDSLVCQVLKAKYFPNGDFLEANVGHSPSYTWRSICSSQDLLRSGTRWRIGDGQKVRVFGDPWLRRDGGFRIRSHYDPELDHLRVSDLIIQGTRQWDTSLVQALLDADEEREVISIPLAPGGGDDLMIWHYAKRGWYTVSSAYKLACAMTIDNNLAIEGNWKAIWDLDVPPKVKHFVWRARQSCLPTKAALMSKGVQVSPECGICGEGFENAWHLFASCSFAEHCWLLLNAGMTVTRGAEQSESFIELLEFILKIPNVDERAEICMAFWMIWRERNSVIWDNKHPHPLNAVTSARAIRREWKAAQSGAHSNLNRRGMGTICKGWHDLQPGWVKCGVDAAFFAQRSKAGVGIVLQDEKGYFVAAKVCQFQGCMHVDEGEAMGLHEALSWIKQLDLRRVMFEVDCKAVCDAVNGCLEDHSEFGAIIKECQDIIKANSNFIVKHIRREANVLAHSFARRCLFFPFAHVWVEPPVFVEGLLHVPCVCP